MTVTSVFSSPNVTVFEKPETVTVSQGPVMVNVLLAPVILRLLPASQVAVVVWPKYPMTVSSPMLTFADVGVLALGEVLVLVDGGVQVPGVGLLEPGLMMPQLLPARRR